MKKLACQVDCWLDYFETAKPRITCHEINEHVYWTYCTTILDWINDFIAVYDAGWFKMGWLNMQTQKLRHFNNKLSFPFFFARSLVNVTFFGIHSALKSVMMATCMHIYICFDLVDSIMVFNTKCYYSVLGHLQNPLYMRTKHYAKSLLLFRYGKSQGSSG